MENSISIKHQFWALVLISILFILVAPSVWYYTPDGGIYIGTAESMVETGQYRFNGYPNLLYYPGFSSLLSLPILVFGVNFRILHLLCACIAVASLWLLRSYFTPSRYGLVGLALPVILACASIFQQQVFFILSDGTFLVISLGALLLWRIYIEKSYRWALITCFALVAFAPMVRFQGLFLSVAFTIALFMKEVSKKGLSASGVAMSAVGGLGTLAPFAAWTWRNLQQHTPHTHNMANSFFFGLKGLTLHAPGFRMVDYIDAEWKYGIYNLMLSIENLVRTFFGYRIPALIPTKVVLIVLVIIVLAGTLRLLKLATNMERAYVLISVAFLACSSLNSHNLFGVTRYWLPLAAFAIVAAGFGLRSIYNLFKDIRYRAVVSTIFGFLIVLILSNGVSNFLEFNGKSNYYRNAHEVVGKVKQFMDEETSPTIPVATTDWGVLPFTLKRTCYKTLNDESHLLTLERMDKYQTGYLVIVDQLGSASPYEQKMVEDLPQLFSLMLEVQPEGEGPAAAVYSVDLEGVQKFLNSASKQDTTKN